MGVMACKWANYPQGDDYLHFFLRKVKCTFTGMRLISTLIFMGQFKVVTSRNVWRKYGDKNAKIN